jgi:hypothetical protein
MKGGVVLMVRCKLKCTDKKDNPDGTSIITLSPVCTGSPENDLFFKYTPWGKFAMGTINESASKQFEVGKEYYVDISLAE